MKYLLFDLDGTISESAPGITQSVQYALSTIGIEEPDLKALEHFVGPPLNTEFKKTYGVDDQTAIDLVQAYRTFYNETGIFACSMYAGIESLIPQLHKQGKKLGICSSKPKVYVEQILANFGIFDCFSLINAPDLQDELQKKNQSDKATLIQQALDHWQVDSNQVAMVGDRYMDICGAKANGVLAIGVTYGYGSYEELIDADILVNSVSQLAQVLL